MRPATSAANIAKLPELLQHWQAKRGNLMNYSTAELDQIDEDFFCEISDETLEAAAGTPIGGGQAMVTVGPTIMIGGCC
jgi:hypothetical protein